MKLMEKLPIAAAAVVLVVLALYIASFAQKQQTSEQVYDQVKELLATKGTQLSTIKMWTDQRTESGTLLRNGKTEIIITAAHFFSTNNADTECWYTMDGYRGSIKAVLPHPGSGSLGGKDIAFCIPGKSAKIKQFWSHPRDEQHWKVNLKSIPPFEVLLLEGNRKFSVMAELSDDETQPIYVIPRATHNGESGSGLITKGRFFVVKGNVPSSSLDFSQVLGVDQSSLMLVTEL